MLGRRVGVWFLVLESEWVMVRRLILKLVSKDGGLGVGVVGVMY